MKKYINTDTGETFTESELKDIWEQFGYEMKFDTYEDFVDSLEEIEEAREEKEMYKTLATFEGTLSVDEINKAVTNLTGDDEPIFDPETDDWRAWVEYKDGKTYILMEEA